MSSPVVTRFAPSPTGYLHIGGARTALFNWLYAKANGGKMLLRIEDTDRARSSQDAIDAIQDGLQWLGLQWDGDAISQFGRAERHREVAEMLVAKGEAYRCYATPEELTQMREEARAAGRNASYDGRWRDRDPSEAPVGIDPVIRIKAPRAGDTLVNDAVQGDVRFPNKDLDDFVILRSDGTPTYMLAVVVDDHDMGVTDIIRGDDHLTNAARQTIIYKAMGWDVPKMAHIPLIHGPDGAKLSKRHGALGVEAYRAMGYLPAALRNYLVRLGWSHGDDEIMSTEQMTQWFGLDAINKGASRFDFAKLEALNGHYMRTTDDADLVEHLLAILPEIEGGPAIADALADDSKSAMLLAAMPALKERAKTLVALAESLYFITADRPLTFDDKAAELVAAESPALYADLLSVLAAVDDWSHDSAGAALKAYAEAKELKLGKVAQPVRAALTARATSPGVFDVMAILGKQETLSRLRDCAKQ